MDLEEANDRVNERVAALTGTENGGAVERGSAAKLLTIGMEIDPVELDRLTEVWAVNTLSAAVNEDAPLRPLLRGQYQQAILMGYMIGEAAARSSE